MTNPLFRGGDLRNALIAQEQEMLEKIGSLSENQVLDTLEDDLCNYFVEKYRVNPLQIDETCIQVDYGDAEIDISQRIDYAVFDGSRPAYVKGTRITVLRTIHRGQRTVQTSTVHVDRRAPG